MHARELGCGGIGKVELAFNVVVDIAHEEIGRMADVFLKKQAYYIHLRFVSTTVLGTTSKQEQS